VPAAPEPLAAVEHGIEADAALGTAEQAALALAAR